MLHHDFHELPEKAYQAFGVTGATFPESFKNTALDVWWVVLGGFALCAFFTWIEGEAKRRPFEPAGYVSVLRALRDAYDGIFATGYFAVSGGAVLAALLVWVEMRTHGHWLPQMSSTIRDLVVNAWWVVVFVPLGAIFAVLFACDVFLWAFSESKPLSSESLTRGFEPFESLITRIRSMVPGRGSSAGAPSAAPEKTPEGDVKTAAATADDPAREEWWVAVLVLVPLMSLALPETMFAAWTAAGFRSYVAALHAVPSGIAFFLVMGFVGDLLRHRAGCLALGGAVVGFILCAFYYPALANQLSPKEVFESYRRMCPDAPLGLVGVGGRTSAYACGRPAADDDRPGERIQLARGRREHAQVLGAEGRGAPQAQSTLEGARARAEDELAGPRRAVEPDPVGLVGTGAARQEREPALRARPLGSHPHPQHRLDVNMDDKLEVLGIDLADERGKLVDSVSPGRTYHLKTYYRVLAPVTTEWEGFIHIDGYHRRHNGDHKPMDGKYPIGRCG